MNILLIGSGGREHALAQKISQSSLCSQLFIAPGNPGTATCGTNINVSVNDFEAIKNICLSENIELLVVGPEDPLVNGIYDFFKTDTILNKIPVIGPSRVGAQLEGSKAFAKEFMQRHQIPTAIYREFNVANYEEGVEYLKQHALPIVLKADGLAAGKGVVICATTGEALAAFEEMIRNEKFGEASKKVVVEQFLTGIELSVFVITDGKNYKLLPEAKDYKRIGEGDTGPNTGGMGAISPVPFADSAFMQKIETQIIKPTINGLYAENIEYTGFIFFGLINVGGNPFVIEYNCRMGDPETEVVIPRLETDLMALMLAAANKELDKIEIKISEKSAATIVAVSQGYPEAYEKGFEISGLENELAGDSIVFQAGTKALDGKIVTNGGRVFCVTSIEETIQKAVAKSLEVIDTIDFEGKTFRKDIGYEFVKS